MNPSDCIRNTGNSQKIFRVPRFYSEPLVLNSNPHDLFYVLFNLRDKFYTSFLFVNCETAEKIFLTLLLRKIVKEISLFYFQSSFSRWNLFFLNYVYIHTCFLEIHKNIFYQKRIHISQIKICANKTI